MILRCQESKPNQKRPGQNIHPSDFWCLWQIYPQYSQGFVFLCIPILFGDYTITIIIPMKSHRNHHNSMKCPDGLSGRYIHRTITVSGNYIRKTNHGATGITMKTGGIVSTIKTSGFRCRMGKYAWEHDDLYPGLVMTNSSPWYRWSIEIDSLPNLIAW